MSDEQAQRAIQQLYEDTSARDELSDEEANVLLAWGEAQIKDMGKRGLDDTAFDDAFTHVRGVMKNINRYTGQRTYESPETLLALLNALATEAQALGVNVQAQQLAIPQAQAADDNIALIQALTALVTPGAQVQVVAIETPAAAAIPVPTAPTENKPVPPVETADDAEDEPPEKPSFFDQIKKLF